MPLAPQCGRPPWELVELHATLEHSWAAQREHWQHEQQPNAALRRILSTPPESVAIVLEPSRAESEDDSGKKCAFPYAMVAHDEGRVCTEAHLEVREAHPVLELDMAHKHVAFRSKEGATGKGESQRAGRRKAWQTSALRPIVVTSVVDSTASSASSVSTRTAAITALKLHGVLNKTPSSGG
eukprot:scaffold44539_cov54-Phaeocystis_antarctica.AAC.1